MAGIIYTLLAVIFGAFVLWMVWSVLNRGSKNRIASLKVEDIEKSANELIQKYGNDAKSEADKLARECIAIGDFQGETIWKLVSKEIRKIQSLGPQN